MATPKRDKCHMKAIEMSEIPHHLPQELITDILLRLPVKPLGRCKCVSKPWRSLLSSPSFVNAHLKLHIHDPQDYIFTDWPSAESFHILTLTSESRRSDGIARMVKFSITEDEVVKVVASCNGLVLLVICRIEDEQIRTILMNPITLEAVEDLNRPRAWSCAYGMGYDGLKDDYTVVSVSEISIVETYSVKMKTWRRLANFPHRLANFLNPAAFLNGRVHFLAMSYSRTINSGWVLAAFSLASEEFEETPLPNGAEFGEIRRATASIMVYEGCLALVYELRDCYKVWVMREYGVQDSWDRFTTIKKREAETSQFCSIKCVLSEDEIALGLGYRDGIAIYNRRTRDWREMTVSNYSRGFYTVQSFRESLLSPITFNGNL